MELLQEKMQTMCVRIFCAFHCFDEPLSVSGIPALSFGIQCISDSRKLKIP